IQAPGALQEAGGHQAHRPPGQAGAEQDRNQVGVAERPHALVERALAGALGELGELAPHRGGGGRGGEGGGFAEGHVRHLCTPRAAAGARRFPRGDGPRGGGGARSGGGGATPGPPYSVRTRPPAGKEARNASRAARTFASSRPSKVSLVRYSASCH